MKLHDGPITDMEGSRGTAMEKVKIRLREFSVGKGDAWEWEAIVLTLSCPEHSKLHYKVSVLFPPSIYLFEKQTSKERHRQ